MQIGHWRSFQIRNAQFSAMSRKSRGCAETYRSYVAQTTPPTDAEIAEKGHFWMETSYSDSVLLADKQGHCDGGLLYDRNRIRRMILSANLYKVWRGGFPCSSWACWSGYFERWIKNLDLVAPATTFLPIFHIPSWLIKIAHAFKFQTCCSQLQGTIIYF